MTMVTGKPIYREPYIKKTAEKVFALQGKSGVMQWYTRNTVITRARN
jgi:hypothetical protein